MVSASSFLILVGGFGNFTTSLNFTTSPPTLTSLGRTVVRTSPSWLVQSPFNSSIVYATDETYAGGLSTLIWDKATGNVTAVDYIKTNGTDPTHIGILDKGNTLAVANYNGASVLFITLKEDHLHFADDGTLLRFNGSGPLPNQKSSHPHQILNDGENIVVNDLGTDTVWRLSGSGEEWTVQSSFSEGAGSGPRHGVIQGSTIYTINEMTASVTSHTFPVLGSGISQQVANISIRPPDSPVNATITGAELLYADTLLYGSNRDDTHPAGDAITIFNTVPSLSVAGYVRTGLHHLRAAAFIGPNNEYIAVAGKNDGAMKIYERVAASEGYLKEVVQLPVGTFDNPSSFIWI